jgi:hypothetical protein
MAYMNGVAQARSGICSSPQWVICKRQGGEQSPRHETVRSVVENANAWLLNNKRLDRRHDRSAAIIQSLLTATYISVVANKLAK